MKIIVLRTGDVAVPVARARGEFAQLIEETVRSVYTGGWETIDVRHGTPAPRLPRPTDADAFIITGSGSSVMDRADWMLESEAFVRMLVEQGAPLLGICFGHQLIAQALGGEVVRNPLGREIGSVAVEVLAGDPLFAGMKASFYVNATHTDTVGRLPASARVLARTALEPTAAFAVGERVRGVQFHPEIDGPAMRGYVEARRDRIESEGLDYESIASEVKDTIDNGQVLRNFVTEIVLR